MSERTEQAIELVKIDNLQELVGQESGIVVYPNGETLICNWTQVSGLPRIAPAGLGLLGLRDPLYVLSDRHIDDLSDEINLDKIIWDINDDAETLDGTTATAYEIATSENGEVKATAYAPHEWN